MDWNYLKKIAKQANERLRKLEKTFGEKVKGKSFAYDMILKLGSGSEKPRFSTAITDDKDMKKRLYQLENFLSQESSRVGGVHAQDERRIQGFLDKIVLSDDDEKYIFEGKNKRERAKRRKEVHEFYLKEGDIGGAWNEWRTRQGVNDLGLYLDSEKMAEAIQRGLQGKQQREGNEWVDEYFSAGKRPWEEPEPEPEVDDWEELDPIGLDLEESFTPSRKRVSRKKTIMKPKRYTRGRR